ncbi:MAG TPA: hypothetical protein VHV10_04440, partial [Ktedonobacteraceae bacterium]|nr:hypothetical protein [Ktedonobacteraceae bacterium]
MARGDFVLIKGFDKVGKWIRVGEIVNGDGLHSLYSHAAMIASDDADPLIIEAEPGGARKNRLSAYGDNWIMSSWNLTDDQRTHLADSAFDMLGIGYSFLDYGSLALARF